MNPTKAYQNKFQSTRASARTQRARAKPFYKLNVYQSEMPASDRYTNRVRVEDPIRGSSILKYNRRKRLSKSNVILSQSRNIDYHQRNIEDIRKNALKGRTKLKSMKKEGKKKKNKKGERSQKNRKVNFEF